MPVSADPKDATRSAQTGKAANPAASVDHDLVNMNVGFRNPLVRAAIGLGATLVLALFFVIILWAAGGDVAVTKNATLIAALIALGGVFTTQMVNSALEDRRARVNSALEDRRASAAALQSYLERMGELLGGKDAPNADARALARAHTLAVLEGEGLDPTRKGVVVQFLCETKLIPRRVRDEQGKDVQEKVVDLSGANLRDADLRRLNLRNVGLDGAFLDRANLRKATLPDADLGGTRLYGADLTDANLSGASLWNAKLQSRPDLGLEAANLRGADLRGADLNGADLREANLQKAKGLSTEQIKWTIGDEKTTNLMEGLHPPALWSKSFEEQMKLVHGDREPLRPGR